MMVTRSGGETDGVKGSECCMCGDYGLSDELFQCEVCSFRSQHRSHLCLSVCPFFLFLFFFWLILNLRCWLASAFILTVRLDLESIESLRFR